MAQYGWAAYMSSRRHVVDGVELDVVLEELRSQLADAAAAAARSGVRFPVQSVTVELKAGLTTTKEGKAGFKVPFVGAELGGSAGREREALQTITLVLGAPVDATGTPVMVTEASDEKPR
jgi:Trypsin-co-occurring domain 2